MHMSVKSDVYKVAPTVASQMATKSSDLERTENARNCSR